MSRAYTPGLKRKKITIVKRIRTLPVEGETLVKVSDEVTARQIVANTFVLGPIKNVNAAAALDLQLSDTTVTMGSTDAFMQMESKAAKLDFKRYMLKKEGDQVKEGEVIALKKVFFGLIKFTCRSPTDGKIEQISDITGQVLIREPPSPFDLIAYIPGKVVEITPKKSVVIETPAAFIQGIFGIGGETHGILKIIAKSNEDILTPDHIDDDCKGKILVAGSLVESKAIHKAVEKEVAGIISGGVMYKEINDFLGYKIGVAITGNEDIGITLITTEGFGKMNMSQKTFDLLKNFEGRMACINGATQIRAGVIRPEIIIPLDDVNEEDLRRIKETSELLGQGMNPGMLVRIIQPPYFGALAHIVSLPIELQELQTESLARVFIVELETTGERVTVPRANVELIEE